MGEKNRKRDRTSPDARRDETIVTVARARRRQSRSRRYPRGVVAAMTAVLLPVVGAFLAFGVDSGLIALTRTRLQNACDAAALAAAQEITSAVFDAGAAGATEVDLTAGSIISERARAVAASVAAANGVYIDPRRDVVFGNRAFDESSGKWSIQWGREPYNTVQVVARRTNPDTSAPDGRLPLIFGTFVGKPTMPLRSGAAAFVESRDLVVVLDFSGSMNDDSLLRSDTISKLGQTAVVSNLHDIYRALEPIEVGLLRPEPQYMRLEGADPIHPSYPKIFVTFQDKKVYVQSSKDLSNVVLEFMDGARQKIQGLKGLSGTFAGSGSNAGKNIARVWVKSGENESGEGPGYGERFDDTVDNVLRHFRLDVTPYPYPAGSWREFVEYCRSSGSLSTKAGYGRQYGGILFANYLMDRRRTYSETPDLWRTPHYPFHAVKQGCSLFLDFVEGLDFHDHVGLVSYDSAARVENRVHMQGVSIDLSSKPLSRRYEDIDQIQRRRQAAHYDPFTNIGAGLNEARRLLETHRRYGARPTIFLMTDGVANRSPAGWTLPAGWSWAKYTDFNDNGEADYVTSDVAKQYAFYQAALAIDAGYTIHTMSVGLHADRALMRAIAQAGGGQWLDVPGGSTIAEIESQLLQGFNQVAAKLPPPQLIYEDFQADVELQ